MLILPLLQKHCSFLSLIKFQDCTANDPDFSTLTVLISV